MLDLEDGPAPETLDGPMQCANSWKNVDVIRRTRKHKALSDDESNSNRLSKVLKQREVKIASKRGRQPGATSWTDKDKNMLLQLVGVVLPISNKGLGRSWPAIQWDLAPIQ